MLIFSRNLNFDFAEHSHSSCMPMREELITEAAEMNTTVKSTNVRQWPPKTVIRNRSKGDQCYYCVLAYRYFSWNTVWVTVMVRKSGKWRLSLRGQIIHFTVKWLRCRLRPTVYIAQSAVIMSLYHVSTWRPWFWPVHSIHYIHTTHYSRIRTN